MVSDLTHVNIEPGETNTVLVIQYDSYKITNPRKFNNSIGTGIFFIFRNISGEREDDSSLRLSWSIIENFIAALCSS